MLKIFVLIILTHHGNGAGAASAQFGSEAACLAAKEVIMAAKSSTKAWCFPYEHTGDET